MAALSISRAVALLAVLVSLGLNLVIIAPVLTGDNTTADLKAEYLMAQALAHGVDPYTSLEVLATSWLPAGVGRLAHPTPHPIFVGWLFLPFAALTFPQTAVTWLLVEVGCLLLSVWLWCRIEGRPATPSHLGLLLVALVAWFPLAMELRLGQLSVLLLTLFLGSWLALQRGKHVAAGLCLGAMVLIKLAGIPILLWLALRGRWRVVGSAAALVAGAHLTALWVHGWPLVLNYYTTIGPQVALEYQDSATNLSVWRLSPVAPLALLPGLLWLAARARTVDTSLSFLFAGGMFLTPVVWVHYFVMAIPAVAVLARRLHTGGWPRWPTLTAAASLVLASLPEFVYVDSGLMVIPAVALWSLLGLLLWSDRATFGSDDASKAAVGNYRPTITRAHSTATFG